MKEFWVLLNGLKTSELAHSLRTADVIASQRMSKKEIEKLIGLKTRVASSAEDSDICLVREEEGLNDHKANRPIAIAVEITSGRDEQKVADSFAKGASYVIIRCTDWKVIPLENIIAKERAKGKVLMEVSNHGEAQLALETLELGSDGVVLNSSSSEEILKTSEVVRSQLTKLDLVEAEVTGKKEVGLGARACVDTTELMMHGEGLLVGCQSNALFLVQAEVEENPFVQSRPFRVNAGPVSYTHLTLPTNREV